MPGSKHDHELVFFLKTIRKSLRSLNLDVFVTNAETEADADSTFDESTNETLKTLHIRGQGKTKQKPVPRTWESMT